MYNVEDIKSCIQEWFAECTDSKEVAKTYAEIEIETEKQLVFILDQFAKTKEK